MNNVIANSQNQFVPYLPGIIKSILIIVIICCILIKPIRDISFDSSCLTRVDQKCAEYLDQTLIRATVVYGLCRATNAAVSFLQEIDIGFDAIGTISLNPFEFLDPLNDLVERFSWILLAAMASIGIQEFLIRLIPGSIINFILLPGLVMWLIGVWTNKYLKINLLSIGKQFVLLAFILRFIIPAEVAINNWIYDYHLKNQYNQSLNNIKKSVTEIKKRTPAEEISLEDSEEERNQQKKGAWNKIKKSLAKTQNTFSVVGDLGSKYNDFKHWLKTEAPILIKNFISLIIVFIINTIFLPIFTLWLIVYLLRIITNSQFGHEVEKKFKERIFQKKQNPGS
ncbi:MAG: hypothetical protein KAQ72_07360 [Desulfobacula sp.]|nr:hypothetical protein [Desulfobacula sp.]